MFCYQCQETAKGSGCTIRGVCGKSSDVARVQDLLIYLAKGIALAIMIALSRVLRLGYKYLKSRKDMR